MTKMLIILFIILNLTIGIEPKVESPLIIYGKKVTSNSNYLFGEAVSYDVYAPSHENWGGLRNRWTNNNAWDIFAVPSTPVYSITAGRVFSTRFRENRRTVWGHNIIIESSYEKVFYTHLDEILLCPGDTVLQGQLIGYVGKWPNEYKLPSGKPMPSHVHIAIYNFKLSDYLDCNLKIRDI